MGIRESRSGISETFNLGRKMKAAMMVKGKTRAWTKCPRCCAKVKAVLAGKRLHLHMACETDNCIKMME